MAENSGGKGTNSMEGLRRNFSIEEEIGRGTSGRVFKARMKKEPYKVVAVKLICKKGLSTAAKDNLINEISALKKLKNRFIVNMIDFTWDDQNIYIIMDYCNKGDLSTFIKKRKALKENIAQIFCQQLCSAMLFMRSNNMSHLDLKPGNLLLHANHPAAPFHLKVADFGFAHCLEDRSSELGLRGSPLYMAPEIVLSGDYDSKVDVWSTGVILYEALYGKAPYSSTTLEELIAKIKEDRQIVLPSVPVVSKHCRDFLLKCLERNPDTRMTWESLSTHPFLDLEYSIPHENSVNKLKETLSIATKAERIKDTGMAVEYYEKAVKYLRTLSYYAEDDMTRQKYQTSLTECRKKLQSHQPSLTMGHDQHISLEEDKYAHLMELSRLTPGMRDGVEICLAARNYQMEGDLSQALDRYTNGLGVLMPLLKTEPAGKRRELLRQAIMDWMKQAESVKARQEASRSCTQETASEVTEAIELPTDSSENKHCIIQ